MLLELYIFYVGEVVHGSGHCRTPSLKIKPFSQPAKAYHCSNGEFYTWHLGEEQRKFGGTSNNERKEQAFEMQRYKSLSRKQIIPWYIRKKKGGGVEGSRMVKGGV